MVPLTHSVNDSSPDQLQARFQKILPTIDSYAAFAHRHCPCHDRRADLTQEMRAVCWKWLLRLADKGIDASLFGAVLAYRAAQHVRNHRRLTGQEKANDVMSPRAQARHGFKVEGLDSSMAGSNETLFCKATGQRRLDEIEERLHDNTVTPIPDQVAFRIDFWAWLATLTGRERRLIKAMARDERTKDLSKEFELSEGRISQKRREFHVGWQRFCGDAYNDLHNGSRPREDAASLVARQPRNHAVAH
jgi:hypothetical protein